jgi:enoyl-CoA hydratase/carnithine racemase
MSYEAISVESRDAIEILTLNRPDALNALSVKMTEELNE